MERDPEVAALREQLQLQELIQDLSILLGDCPPEDVDQRIHTSLQRIVEFLGIDRSSFGEFSEDFNEVSITHSYSVPGVPSYPKGNAFARLPWLFRKAMAREMVVLEQLEDFPPEGAVEKAYFQSEGMKSHLMIPFSVGGKMLCAIGFGAFRAARKWPEPLRFQLKRVGEILAHAVYRKRAEEKIRIQLSELESRSRFEQLIADISAEFVNLPSDRVDEQIEKSLEQLLLYFQIDRLALLEVSKEGTVATVTHSANAAGIKPAPVDTNYVDLFPWHSKRLLSGEVVYANIESLPPEAEKDRESARAIGIQSNLVIPLIESGAVRHVLAANTITAERIWEQELVPRIRLLAEIFTGALARKQAQQELADSYAQIKELKNRLEAEAEYLRSEIHVAYQYDDIVGESRPIREVLAKLEQVAPTSSSVLILGETGTGKELIARAIHNLSPRRGRAMVKVNCASLPSTLIESELFGREKGAYTGALSRQMGRFELADESTIFLDEIGELSAELQTKLLRVLQEGEFERLGSPRTIKVNVRVIAATNSNLLESVRKGSFRQDLYYRLNVFPITVPALRERPKDIPLLVNAFLNEFTSKMGKNIDTIPKQTMDALIRYQWPGNIRELRNVIEHSVIISNGNVLKVQLPDEPASPGSGRRLTLEDAERKFIRETLESTGWVIKGPHGAATLLKVKPSTLYNKMRKLDIVRPERIS